MTFRVYLITDPAYDVVEITRAALAVVPRGSVAVQARDKSASPAELAALARALRPICHRAGAPLLVNDRADVARAVGADGVHLPERGLDVADARAVLGEGAIIGSSRHDKEGVARAAEATFVTLGPVFEVPHKGPAIGVESFAAACAATALPVYALGGIDAVRAPALRAKGAAGVAVIRSVYAAPDPGSALRALVDAAQ